VTEHVGTGVLADRGWTPAAIRRFLGEPDRTAPNPVYRSKAPMRLYLLERVEQAEATPEWVQWRQAADRRVAAGRKAAEARRQATVAEVEALRIRVPVMAWSQLALEAVRHRNDVNFEWAARRGELADPATVAGVDEATLRRWAVNYLRHARTVYDAALDGLYARVGRAEATELVRSRVFAAIAEAYPVLAGEVERQVAERAAC